MFALKRPCVNCPFRREQGGLFALSRERLEAIREAPAFQCHKTVVYGEDPDTGDETHDPGSKPQQCAGLMAVLARDGRPNQIMQVAERLKCLDVSQLDPRNEAHGSWAEVLEDHARG